MASTSPGRQGLPASLKRHGALVLGGLAAVLLLLLFQQVARGAVQQGDERRKAIALRADAVWQCTRQRDHDLREQCLTQAAPAR
jgi:hypothetical protein